MSSVPVVLPLKVPVRYDLVQPLANWLDSDQATSFSGTGASKQSSDNYNTDADDAALPPPNLGQWIVPKPAFSSVECRSELLRLAALRNCLSENLQDGHKVAIDESHTTTGGLEDCCDYHATLLEFEKRGFPAIEPISDSVVADEEDDHGINLSWKGAFATKQQETHHSLCWDRACTLWNVVSFQSYLADKTDKSTKEGCKVAISQYQTAASNMKILKQLVQSQKETSGSSGDIDDYDSTPLYRTVDFSKSMLEYWENLFCALAQQTIYKLANLPTTNPIDGSIQQRQHSTLAYLIQAAAKKYNEALVCANSTRLQSEVPKQSEQWSLHCKAQSLICQARAMFHLSIDSRLKREHGMEIARLTQCVSQLKEAHGFYKSAKLDVSQELQGLIDLSRDRLTKATDDNKTIYMDDIPKELPEIVSKYMVKESLPLSPSLMVSKVPLFEWCQ